MAWSWRPANLDDAGHRYNGSNCVGKRDCGRGAQMVGKKLAGAMPIMALLALAAPAAAQQAQTTTPPTTTPPPQNGTASPTPAPPAATSPSNGETQLPPVQVIQKQEQTPPAAKKTVAAKKPPAAAPCSADQPPTPQVAGTGGIDDGTVLMSPVEGSAIPIGKYPGAVGRASAADIAALGHHLCAEHHSANGAGRDTRRPAGQRLPAEPAVPRVQLFASQWRPAGACRLPKRRAHQRVLRRHRQLGLPARQRHRRHHHCRRQSRCSASTRSAAR